MIKLNFGGKVMSNKILRKLTLTTLCLFIVTSAFADIHIIKSPQSKLEEIFTWQSLTPDDGLFFVLDPDSKVQLVLQVNQTVPSGAIADPITVYCDATSKQVEPNSWTTCDGNLQDVIAIRIKPDAFHNGAQGTYQFKTIKS
jgi:hypothetical protein